MGSLQRTSSWLSLLSRRQHRYADGKHPPHNSVMLSAAICTALTSTTVAAADTLMAYPSRPIRLMVPTAPGAGPDINARLIASEIGKQLGQQVVVDNRAGASGIISFETLARAAPDGYTLGYLNQNFLTNPSLFVKLPYDSTKDFLPVILHGSSSFLLTVTPSLPIRSVKDLIAQARANPGKFSYGSAGVGSAQTLAMELLKLQTDTNIVRVIYKGIQQAITDAIGGQIDIVCDNIASILPQARAGRLRGLGVTSLKRSPVAPELPTLDEAGIPGYEYTVAGGYAVPAGVPHAIVMRLNTEINKALQLPMVIEKFATNGQTAGGGTPQQFAQHIRSETAKWAKVIKAAGIKPQ